MSQSGNEHVNSAWSLGLAAIVTGVFLVLLNFKVKVKVKFTLERLSKIQRGSRGIALFFL